MAIYALADPHLSFSTDKPMDIFGERWKNHDIRISSAWKETVKEEDTVIIPGDISWAMTLQEVIPDLRFLHELPGRKIISKGNHDYWWGTMGKLEKLVEEQGFFSLSFLKNNAYVAEDTVICGSRGWIHPEDPDFTEADKTIYDRELGRFRRSLIEGKALRDESSRRMIAVLHYPPMLRTSMQTEFTELLYEFSVDVCIFGHLHGLGIKRAFEGTQNGTEYRLTSADHLSFKPLRL